MIGEYPALQDFPEHAYQGLLLSRLLQGDPVVAATFSVTGYPVPNSLSQCLLAIAMLVLPPVLAARILLLGYLVVFIGLLVVRFRRANPSNAGGRLLVATILLTVNSTFWNGYLNFQLSLLILAWALGHQFLTRFARVGEVVLFSGLLFFAHAITFIGFVSILTVGLVVMGTWRGASRIGIGLLPVLVLGGWFVVGRDPSTSVGVDPDKQVPSGLLGFLQYKTYTVMKQGPFQVFEFPDGTSHLADNPVAYQAGVVINGVFACILIVTLIDALLRKGREGDAKEIRIGKGVVGLLVLAFTACPPVALGVVNPGERFLVIALLVALASLPLRPAGVTTLAVICLFGIPATGGFLLDSAQPRTGAQRTRHRLFTHRPFQFERQGRALAGTTDGELPPLTFRTSVVRMRNE